MNFSNNFFWSKLVFHQWIVSLAEYQIVKHFLSEECAKKGSFVSWSKLFPERRQLYCEKKRAVGQHSSVAFSARLDVLRRHCRMLTRKVDAPCLSTHICGEASDHCHTAPGPSSSGTHWGPKMDPHTSTQDRPDKLWRAELNPPGYDCRGGNEGI